MKRGLLGLLLLARVILPAPVAAQSQRAVCWSARPKESCAFVVLTNVGGYLVAGPIQRATGYDPTTGAPTGFESQIRIGPRALADWGVLANVTSHDAFGASVVASFDYIGQFNDHAYFGAYLRYRRWFGARQSLDLAVGTPVFQSSHGRMTPYGLVKWNLNPTVGVALRPELRRIQTFDERGPVTRSDFRLSAGVEVGGWPGFATSVLGGGAAIVAVLIAFSHSN